MPVPEPLAARHVPGLRWRVIVTSILTITVAILPGFLPGALAVQLAESLGIAEAGIGLIVGAFFGMSALASPRLGRLVERLDWAPATRIAALGAAATLLVTPLLGRSVVMLGLVTVAGGSRRRYPTSIRLTAIYQTSTTTGAYLTQLFRKGPMLE